MPAIPAIEAENLTKVYTAKGKATRAVDGISFALAPGTVTGLLGGNGAGKTTTIAMILGLIEPTSGHARVMGAEMPRERYRVLHRMNFESPYVDMPNRLTVRAEPDRVRTAVRGRGSARAHRRDRQPARSVRSARPAEPASSRPARRPASRWPRR